LPFQKFEKLCGIVCGNKKELLDEARKKLVKRMDIIFFLEKMEEIEKLKSILLNED
jgi:hypothetical protein